MKLGHINRDIDLNGGESFDYKAFKDRTVNELIKIIEDSQKEKEDLIREIYAEKRKCLETGKTWLFIGIWIGVSICLAFYL